MSCSAILHFFASVCLPCIAEQPLVIHGKHTEVKKPASVAQLDAPSTGDQEVADSTPAEVGNNLPWRLIMKYFLRSFSPFR